MNIQEQEEREFTITSIAEWDQADAHDRGFGRPDQCWVLSDRDVWYRNPYYRGPVQPHPEFDEPEALETAAAVVPAVLPFAAADDIPF